MLNKLISIKNNRPGKRLGRGLSSGKGRTSGRGTKGQKSRSGHNIPRSFEGGQTPLIQRLAKARGFHGYKTKPPVLSIEKIEKNFNDGDVVNLKTLHAKGLIADPKIRIKILGPGKLTKKLKFNGVVLNKSLLAQYKAMDKTVAEKPVLKKPVVKKPTTKKPTVNK